MTRTILEIWSGVLSGDAKSWRELVDLYAPLVYTVACRTGLCPADAEDCSQQVWIKLYRRRSSIKDPIALPAWLIRTSHRHALTMRRQQSQRAKVDELHELSAGRLPDELVTSIEESALLQIAISQLDGRCRVLIQKLYLDPNEQSYLQLARELKIKPNSLGPLRSRCLNKLRKILENLGWRTD